MRLLCLPNLIACSLIACSLAAFAPLAALADDPLPKLLQDRLDTAAADCKGLDNGMLSVAPEAVSRPDLDGDGAPDWALDESRLQCSTSASYFCGSGGCTTVFLVAGTLTEVFGHGWQLVQTQAGPVVLSFNGGVDCGLAQYERCVRALVWGDGRWNTQPAAD
ncbi:MAG: hypothetical protein IAE87_01750 [Rhodobacteraceae bacterium]|jgi:hypothetical protein|nr:hypothetical protein [Paracoccaceae bacterium]